MKFVHKDITTIESPAVIAHGVNCQNAMGSGVARSLFEKWNKVKTEYHKFTNKTLGNVQFVCVDKNLYVANCFTQENYGRDGKVYASVDAIDISIRKVCNFAKKSLFLPNVIHIPKIGCGLGGLDFDKDVVPILINIEEETKVDVVVCCY